MWCRILYGMWGSCSTLLWPRTYSTIQEANPSFHPYLSASEGRPIQQSRIPSSEPSLEVLGGGGGGIWLKAG